MDYSAIWFVLFIESLIIVFQTFAKYLTLPDLSLLLPTTLSEGGGRGRRGSVDPLLTHNPFALTASNLVGCSRSPKRYN